MTQQPYTDPTEYAIRVAALGATHALRSVHAEVVRGLTDQIRHHQEREREVTDAVGALAQQVDEHEAYQRRLMDAVEALWSLATDKVPTHSNSSSPVFRKGWESAMQQVARVVREVRES